MHRVEQAKAEQLSRPAYKPPPRARAAAVNLWTSPADRRAPIGACGQPVDNALGRVVIDRAFRRALPTGCPHSRTSRPQPHRFSNKIFFSKKREGPNRKKGTFLLCVPRRFALTRRGPRGNVVRCATRHRDHAVTRR